jgi:hypothetical protein
MISLLKRNPVKKVRGGLDGDIIREKIRKEKI